MKKMFGVFVFCIIAIILETSLASAPTHHKLLYHNPLIADGQDGFATATNYQGSYSNAGWTALKGSKLILQLNNRLPATGTIEITVRNFNPAAQATYGKQTLFCFTSRPHSSLDLFAEDSLTSFMYLRTGTNFFTAPGRCGLEFDTAYEGYTSRDKEREVLMDYRWNSSASYQLKFVWDHDSIWFFFDGQEIKRQNFKTPIERIRHISIGGDDIYNTMAGPIYSDLKIYTASTSVFFQDQSFSKQLQGHKDRFGGNGIAVADVNRDGRDDIFITSYQPDKCIPDLLYLQQSDGSFSEESAQRGIHNECGSFAPVFFDADNDGDLDLFTSTVDHPNRLFINDGNGYFLDQGVTRGLLAAKRQSGAAVALDIDKDGDLDLFIANAGVANELYVNNGTGNFTLENRGTQGPNNNQGTVKLPLITVADIDGDLDPDIYLTHQDATNELYLNDGTGHFRQAAGERGLALSDSTVASATFADWNQDGAPDLWISHEFHSFNADSLFLQFFENDGRGFFTDRTNYYRIPMHGAMVQALDADNDGNLELYSWQNSAYDKEYLNRVWTFYRSSVSRLWSIDSITGFQSLGDCGADLSGRGARAVSANDFDGDGDLDLIMTTNRFENVYLENQINGTGNNWIEIATIGPGGDWGGIGSKIMVYEAGFLGNAEKMLGRSEVTCQTGYATSNNLRQHFGLGAHTAVDVRILRPDQSTIEYRNLPANQRHFLTPQVLQLSKASGDSLTGTCVQPLPDWLRVRITNTDGMPQANVPVIFKVVQGDGYLLSDSLAVTDLAGYARASFFVGHEPEHHIQAKVQGAVGSPVTFTVFSKCLPIHLLKLSGDAQSGRVAEPLAQSIVVRAVDTANNVIPNYPVVFRVAPANGNLAGDSVRIVSTDNSGLAAVSWTLGTQPGTLELFAATEDMEVVFTATALAGPAQSLRQISGAGQLLKPGVQFPQPFQAQVIDSYGNEVPNHPVIYQVIAGGGHLNGTVSETILTDAMGIANGFWTPGPYLGPDNILSATSYLNNVLLSNAPVTWRYAGIAVDPGKSTITGTDSVAADGIETAQIVVILGDSSGQNVGAGFTVKVSTTGSENFLVQPDTLTNAAGQVRAFLTSTLAETKQISARILGLDWQLAETIQVHFFAAADNLVKIAGDLQTGIVGQPLAEPMVVKVIDSKNRPLVNYPVKFKVLAGGGNFYGLPEYAVTTDGAGLARALLTLGAKEGDRNNQVQVFAERAKNSPLTFYASARAIGLFRITKVSGDSQKVEVGQTLPQALVVQVFDTNNNPLAAEVTFTAPDGGRVLTPQPILSDRSGFAASQVSVGPDSGQYHFQARIADNLFVVFYALASSPAVNHAPAFTRVISDTVINEGQELKFSVVAVDSDGDPIRLTAENLPNGALFSQTVGQSSAEFVWTPTFEQSGNYQVIFAATDPAGASARHSCPITVLEVNRPPQITAFLPGDTVLTVSYGAQLKFSLQAQDADGDSLVYQWQVNQMLVGFESSVTIVPSSSWPQEFWVRGLVSDRKDTVAQSWKVSIDITDVNLALFSAIYQPARGVVIRWATNVEFGNVGFNVWRSHSETGNYRKLNEALITLEPDTRAAYEFLDVEAKAGVRYFYQLEAIASNGQTDWYGPIVAATALPEAFALHQNYPNPFNPATQIRFGLPEKSRVTVCIYNSAGQRVKTLVDGELPAGDHTVVWDGTNDLNQLLASGSYYYALQSEHFRQVRKLMFLK